MARLIFHVLSRFGESELAYKMITRREEPSYASLVEKGETSLPEMFDSPDYKAGKGISFNHHFFGDVSHWFFANILGISVNPDVTDPDSVLIRPCEISDITFARGKRIMPHGEISLEWERRDGGIFVKITTAGDVKASVDGHFQDVQMLRRDKA